VGNTADTKERILDAAEELFADVGYDATYMRDVAKRARLLLGLITYHFGTKEKLFEEVIARRAEELNAKRRQALGLLVNPTVEEILEAYQHPYLELMLGGDDGWHSYGRLIAQIGQSDRWAKLSAKHFSKLGHAVIEQLMKAEPRLSWSQAVHGYVHLVSVMFGVFATSGLLDIFSDGSLHSADITAAYNSMIHFVAGGIRSLAASSELATLPARKRAPRRAPRLKIARSN
jgi:AcrR family transcriptional regulator